MQEMPKIPGLQRRRLTYYLRVRVPQELVSLYKKKEIVCSLETRDYETARKRVHKKRAIIEAEFDEKLHQIKAAANNSLRAGLATSAAAAGIASHQIRAQTGHKSDAMLARYIREGGLFTGNAAALF